MKNEKPTKKVLLHDDHPKPVTRRDFLAAGFQSLAAYTFLPSLFSAIPYRAFAQNMNCGSSDENGLIPFLVFDMAGGGGLPANFLVGKQGGPEDYLASYDLLGWDPKTAGIDKRFGLPMAPAAIGKVLEGMLTSMSPDAQARLQMASICHQSQDDSSRNTTSAIMEVARAGLQGKMIKNGLGLMNSVSGGNTIVPTPQPTLKPLSVGSVNDVIASTGYEMLSQELPTQSLLALAKANLNLSRHQIKNLEAMPNGQQLKVLAECGYMKNVDLIAGGTDVDPRRVTAFQNLYNINPSSQPNSLEVRSATVVLNTLTKTAGPGALTIGGCDYHDGTQTTGDQKDLETGLQIGRAVEAAHRLQKPLMFQVVTDGGVYAVKGTRRWQGDAGDKSMTVIGYYDPKGAPKLIKTQIGHYTDGQGAERDTFVGKNTSVVAYAVFANYLNMCGKLGEFEKYVSNSEFPKDKLNDVLVFG